MQLIGMLDSPYVRRTAISLDLLGIPFEHRPLSVFRDFDAYAGINPVVKAPTLVLDDGGCLMDSNLIIDYAECLAGRGLLPELPADRGRVLAQVGLALAACEKTMQMVYEVKLRPPEKQHQPWLDRVESQLLGACNLLEHACDAQPSGAQIDPIDQGGVSTAVAWAFMQLMLPQVVPASRYPRLAAWSAWAETLPAFRRYPIA